jgi:hypothetical protein
MNEKMIESLDQLLTLGGGSTSFTKSKIPENLLDTKYIREDLRPPQSCPFLEDCRAFCECERDDSELIVECDEGHEGRIPVEDHLYFDISFEPVLEAIAEAAGRELAEISESTLPKYVTGVTDDGVNLYLIVSPSDYEKAVNEICIETLKEDTPALLVTPQKTVMDLLEIKSLFSSSNLIYTVPFTMLTEPDLIQNSLSTIEDIQGIEQRIIQDLDGEHPVVNRVNSNPRYILTELNHMRLLRLAKELPQHSGTRLEKIGETAFSHLFVSYPEAGGEDDRGGNVPDNLFYISNSILPEGAESVLGIADTKSGDDAGFGSEKVEGKHDEYLKKARRHSVGAEKIAHMFLILGFDGQKEIEFYDKMADIYEDDEYLVIMTAEALSLILAGYLAHTVANDLKLIHGNFQAVIHPFFDNQAFQDSGLGGLTRVVGKNQEEYADDYKQRENLMIITQEVVKKRLEQCVDSPNDVEEIFKGYFKPLPTI